MSIKKIAAIAGVSTATVSRVLNNLDYKCSSEELREKIWQIAREMNYMPNEAARNFLVIKSRTNEKENLDAADYKRIRKYEGTFGC